MTKVRLCKNLKHLDKKLKGKWLVGNINMMGSQNFSYRNSSNNLIRKHKTQRNKCKMKKGNNIFGGKCSTLKTNVN